MSGSLAHGRAAEEARNRLYWALIMTVTLMGFPLPSGDAPSGAHPKRVSFDEVLTIIPPPPPRVPVPRSMAGWDARGAPPGGVGKARTPRATKADAEGSVYDRHVAFSSGAARGPPTVAVKRRSKTPRAKPMDGGDEIDSVVAADDDTGSPSRGSPGSGPPRPASPGKRRTKATPRAFPSKVEDEEQESGGPLESGGGEESSRGSPAAPRPPPRAKRRAKTPRAPPTKVAYDYREETEWMGSDSAERGAMGEEPIASARAASARTAQRASPGVAPKRRAKTPRATGSSSPSPGEPSMCMHMHMHGIDDHLRGLRLDSGYEEPLAAAAAAAATAAAAGSSAAAVAAAAAAMDAMGEDDEEIELLT